MMVQLARDPKVIQLTKDLGLDWRGDCLYAIRQHVMAQVDRIVTAAPIPVDTLDMLRWIVANKFRAKLEFIKEDADLDSILVQHADFHSLLRQRLIHEFLNESTEGITLEREIWDPRVFRYLAVVDARGDRAIRAYFTAWHEITHLLLHPEQLPFPGFRRTASLLERAKDSLESVVDHVAGRLAFYPPFFEPALDKAVEDHGGLSFEALDAARLAAAPTASLFATAMGSLHHVKVPTILVSADMSLKTAEHRFARGAQQAFAFAAAEVTQKLRVTTVVPNDGASKSLSIRRNMRVPLECALTSAHASAFDITLDSLECQSAWETSSRGHLAALPIRVRAARRGRFVYGLVSAVR